MPLTDQSIVSALRELGERGLIARDAEVSPLSEGNIDRRELPVRTSWRVTLPDGRLARLALGADLTEIAQRQSALADECPRLIPTPCFHVRTASLDAFVDEFFEGKPLDTIAVDSPESAREAFATVVAALEATQRSSTEIARLAEWQAWSATVEKLPIWSPDERQSLRDIVLPRLYQRLTTGKPARRWTNGDLTTTNILVDPRGNARLIDCEFAGQTHFFGEDAARFFTFSPAARQRPELFVETLPRSAPAWHLYFWLRQLAMEVTHNSEAYLARMSRGRREVIRRLAEQVLGCPLTGWSIPPAPLYHTLEIAHWKEAFPAELYISGWCHVPGAFLVSVQVSRGDQLLLEARPSVREDVRTHFGGDPLAFESGYTLNVPLGDSTDPLLVSVLANDGRCLPVEWIDPVDLPGRMPWFNTYARWAAAHDPDPPPPAANIAGPLISILLPVYNPPPGFLRACLDSVLRQHYSSWELCLVDDASPTAEIRTLLADYAAKDSRIKLNLRNQNGGISAATNDALASARGDFIVLLDHDDLLRPHALLEFVRRLEREPSLDVLYSDEDKITAEGVRDVPFLKPDFSPEFLLGVMYIGHALCVRTEVARIAGGFDPAFDGVQDFAFFLRVREHTQRVGHVPQVLYHWRQSASSSALHGNVKGDMDAKQQSAVRAHLHRLGRTEHVQPYGRHRVRLNATRQPSIELFRPATLDQPLTEIRRAANSSRAEILVFLTAGAAPPQTNWVDELAGVASLADSGLVAPLILFPDGRVRESGWTANRSCAAPIMRGFALGYDGYNGSLLCTREVSAVSPLCFALRRATVLSALSTSPADETWLAFCLRLRADGLYHRVCPTAQITVDPNLTGEMEPCSSAGLADPLFNPAFDGRRADYSLARPPPFL